MEQTLTEPSRYEELLVAQKRVFEQIAEGAPLDEVLESLVLLVEEHSAEDVLGSVLLLDEDGRRLRHGAAPSLPATYNEAIDGIVVGPEVGSCGTAAYRGERVVVTDIANDPLWADFRDLALAHGLRSCWSTPITSRGGKVLGTFALYYREPRAPGSPDLALIDLMIRAAAVAIERHKDFAEIMREKRIVETLHEVGQAVVSELDLTEVVQRVTDAATELTHAQFGAFFYNVVDEKGESYMLYTLSGVPREAFEVFPQPRNTKIFDPTFRGLGVVRLDDVTLDPRFGKNPPYHGMPKGHLPVRSYLAVPVKTSDGEVVGGLFFGHPDPEVFTDEAERLAVGIAAQAAIAIQNAHLHQAAQREIEARKAAAVRLLQVIAVASNEATDPRAALEIAVHEICAYTGWPVGHVFLLQGPHSDELVSSGIWHLDDPERYSSFVDATGSAKFGPGVGIPARMLRTRRPLWIVDPSEELTFERSAAAADVGFRGLFALPILIGQEVVGVAEFFSHLPEPPNQDLMDVLTQIGTQLGRVIERREIDSFKDQFISNAAHELRTPLTTLIGFSKLLSDHRESLAHDKMDQVIHSLDRQADRLNALVTNLLDLTRIQQKRMSLDIARLELAAVIDEALEAAPPPDGTSVKLEVPPGLTAQAAEVQLVQVLTNLLINAYRYGGPHVVVAARREEESVVVRVADDGPGVPESEVGQLFLPFQRGTSAEAVGGSGLGLAIARMLLRAMGGDIRYRAREDGGAEFALWLESAT